MNRTITLVAIAILSIPTLAFAQPAAPDPAQQALVQMIGEAQSREAQALVQVYTLRAQFAAEKKRADDAEAKLKAADEPSKLTKP